MAGQVMGRHDAVMTRGPAPFWLPLGAALLAVGWWTAWFGPRPWSEHTFFPLWLGYILLVDGLTAWRTGMSLLRRSPGRFALLFVVSVPLWWLFEFANHFLGNWRYLMPERYSPLTFRLLASLDFSTVVPALFVTATFWRSTRWFDRPIRWIRIAPPPAGLAAIAAAGLALFVGSLAFPRYLFPFVWIGLFLLLDPINALIGNRSLAAQVRHGRWDTVVVLFAAGLTCGFFWEMWNVWSMPKWIYIVPFVPSLRLFEMPLPGYGGYLPFALEVYAAYQLIAGLAGRLPAGYLTFDRLPEAEPGPLSEAPGGKGSDVDRIPAGDAAKLRGGHAAEGGSGASRLRRAESLFDR